MVSQTGNHYSSSAPLPFAEPSEEQQQPFDSVLTIRYVKPALRWILGQDSSAGDRIDPNEHTIATVTSHCWWGMGLCIEAFLNALHLQGLDDEERVILAEHAVQFSRILLNAQRENDSSWDGASWDTAVVGRSLLILAQALRDSTLPIVPDAKLVGQIETSVRGAVEFLVVQILNQRNLRYAFGPEDMCQVVRLLCRVCHYDHRLFPRKSEESGIHSTTELVEQLLNHLIDEQTTSDPINGESHFKPWKAAFASAHALLAFSDAYSLLSDTSQNRVLGCMLSTIEVAEKTQSGGIWGMPDETTLMLQAYINACSVVRQTDSTLRPKPDVVFRAVRWLADEKQRFSDGSILHVTDYTFSFVLAFQTVIAAARDTGFLRMTVPQVYDYVLWGEQMQVSQERGERMRVIVEYQQEKQLRKRIAQSANVYVDIVRVIGTVAILLAFLGFAVIVNWAARIASDPAFAVAYITAAVSVASLFWIVSRKLSYKVSD